jgi:Zn ribbon nucleic-acid-binding protein
MVTLAKEANTMAMNSIQFQQGLSLNDFLIYYGTEEKCSAALEKSRWPAGFICPACQNTKHCIVWHSQVKTFQCNTCHTQTTLTAGSIFHSTKLPLLQWFQAMYFFTQSKNNVSALELKRLIGVCYKTAWRIKHKIMQVMAEQEQDTVLFGRVEVDDAYLGGENPGGKAGRGSENKIPFIAAVETNEYGHPLRAVFTKVPAFTSEVVVQWAKSSLVVATTVISDGYACFRAVTAAGCFHKPTTVGKKRKSTDITCFNWVNTILGNLKTAMSGTYHAFKFEKYGTRYLGDVQYRFNHRTNLRGMLDRLVHSAATTGKRPEHFLRLAEDWR